MTRVNLQALAQERLADAGILLANNRWSAAYYLVGYSVELGLKSCVLHHIEKTGMIFKDRKFLKKLEGCWTHSFKELMNLADLDGVFYPETASNLALGGFWGIVKDWTEGSRYELKSQVDAEVLYEAITNDPNGVLLWIRQHW